MSLNLNAMSLGLGDETVTLRLTARAIRNYAKKHGENGANPLVAVLSAADDLEAKIDLFTAALSYNGNNNRIKDGADLLDLMADSNMGRKKINRTIVELAVDAGLMDDDQRDKLSEALDNNDDKFIDIVIGVMTGESGPELAGAEEPSPEENPT